MSTELDRITHPLRLARGSHQPGKGRAMNFISYINGYMEMADYPTCLARPLAKLVESLRDDLADEDGYLSPKNSVLVMNLGWRTVGTAGAPREVVLRWLAELLIDPVHGVAQHASPAAVPAIQRVAELLKREVAAGTVSYDEWVQARTAAHDADADHRLAYTIAAAAAYAVADSTYAADVAIAASYSHPYADQIEFTRWAIEKWRELAKLDKPQQINADDINKALEQIGAHA